MKLCLVYPYCLKRRTLCLLLPCLPSRAEALICVKRSRWMVLTLSRWTSLGYLDTDHTLVTCRLIMSLSLGCTYCHYHPQRPDSQDTKGRLIKLPWWCHLVLQTQRVDKDFQQLDLRSQCQILRHSQLVPNQIQTTCSKGLKMALCRAKY